MRPKFQSKQEVIINAPLEQVWEFNMDLSRIAEYHPRVNQVDLISGKQFREPGVSYQCHLLERLRYVRTSGNTLMKPRRNMNKMSASAAIVVRAATKVNGGIWEPPIFIKK